MSLQTRLVRKLAHWPHDLDDKRGGEAAISRSFLVLVATNFLTKIGDALASPKITLTWLLQTLGASPLAIGLLVPLRESGSMLPQIWLASHINGRRRVKRLHQLGTLVQGLAILGMVAAAATLDGTIAGWAVILLLAAFSLGRCLCSIVWKAVLGKAIPKQLRGQTTGWSSSTAGLGACLVGVYLLFSPPDRQSLFVILALLTVAAGSWLVATAVYGILQEPADDAAAAGESTGIADRFRLLVDAPHFRDFVVARGLLMASALVAPYYILLAAGDDSALATFGGLIVANGVAGLVSGPFWGRFSDVSSRRVLMLAGTLVAALGVATGLLSLIDPAVFAVIWVVPLLYFVLAIAHQGVRVGRKTYVVDLAGDDTRVDYVSTSNTMIGILLVVVGAFTGLIALVVPPVGVILVFSGLSLAGVVMSRRLPEVQRS